ncbi:MAG: hypothetical protein ACRECG_11520 [Bradyrhizobium sp.]
MIAAICAAIASVRLRRGPRHFPSLTSRLRVAIKSGPVNPDRTEALRNTAAATLRDPSAADPRVRRRRPPATSRPARRIQA